MHTLKDEARFLRLLGQPEKSLAIIQPIFAKLIAEQKDDGWIREELAESLHAAQARPMLSRTLSKLSLSLSLSLSPCFTGCMVHPPRVSKARQAA